ncbi:unnamed protein product [Clonostachys rosea f. rosea IK726]|uniref:Uncharacterized protein n=1 Tax=Clonostachys rosea f. rosea IK726 TaxID=1349383 RepID=A0ACA9U345_BIOOC|nr:unnamed protein product [Clonostachys rosea f. rosea IK726]
MESQGLALPAFARNSLGQFFPTVQYCMDHFRSGPPSDGTCLNYAILALQATQGWAGDMSVPPHARLWVTAGHTGSSQASMPPDTNPDDLPDPAPDFFVGASEPMFEGPSFWFPDQPLPELSPSFADLPSSALNEPQIFPQVEGCWNEPVPETPSSSTASSAAAEHKCSSCGKVKPERDFSLREGRLAATCEQCRAIRRQYYHSPDHAAVHGVP